MSDRNGISVHIGVDVLDPSCYPLDPPHRDYPNGWDGPLKGCEKDARDMRSIAESQGFETTLLLTKDATADNVESAIRDAATNLKSGDIFMLTYAGHGGQVLDRSGDEEDREDETWCLHDRHFLDDELYALYTAFDEGVRILVFSDSCHSGTVTRAAAGEVGERPVRAMPRSAVYQIYKAREPFYNEIQDRVKAAGQKDVKASIRLLSACQDHQEASGGEENGAFTAAVKRVWNNGNFDGDYEQFYEAVKIDLAAAFAAKEETRGSVDSTDDDIQVPNFTAEGTDNPGFDKQTPFSI
ncbi:MAG: caspase family protein [Pseudomonadota bacterium]